MDLWFEKHGGSLWWDRAPRKTRQLRRRSDRAQSLGSTYSMLLEDVSWQWELLWNYDQWRYWEYFDGCQGLSRPSPWAWYCWARIVSVMLNLDSLICVCVCVLSFEFLWHYFILFYFILFYWFSFLLKSYLDHSLRSRVVTSSAHAAFEKACHYFGIKFVLVPVEEKSFRTNVPGMRQAITPNTIAVRLVLIYSHAVDSCASLINYYTFVFILLSSSWLAPLHLSRKAWLIRSKNLLLWLVNTTSGFT